MTTTLLEPTWRDYQAWIGPGCTPQGTSPHAPLPSDFHYDSRTLKVGAWYFPLVGSTFDGHTFILNAIEQKGARGFFFDPHRFDIRTLPVSLQTLGVAVGPTLPALQAIASGWRRRAHSVKVVALSGSSGKTTVKAVLGAMFAGVFPENSVLCPASSLNNEIGVPQTLCRITPATRRVVLEMGARHRGDLRFLVGLANPDVVGLLNVGSAHVGEFGGPEALLEAKLEILRSAEAHATAVYPLDDPRIARTRQSWQTRTTISFGTGADADVRVLTSTVRQGAITSVQLAVRGEGSVVVDIPLVHEHCAVNVAAALAMARAAGDSTTLLSQGAQKYSPPHGRYQMLRTAGPLVIDDTYNANPHSMLAGLTSVARLEPRPKSILFVLGTMKELGDQSDDSHRAVGRFVAETFPSARLVIVGSEAKPLMEGAIAAGLTSAQICHVDDVRTWTPDIPHWVDGTDLVYLKGSRAVTLDVAVNALLQHFGPPRGDANP